MININKKLENFKKIPLENYSKIPSVKWGTDEELTFKGNETGYAIDTGRSNLVVIDCDNKNGVDGVNAFIELCQQNGGIPETLSVSTPNNGVHFYFIDDHNMKFKSSAGTILGKGIDVRANGGYIVAPGSEIKDSNGEIKEYEVDDDTLEIAFLPNWIFSKLMDQKMLLTNEEIEKDKKVIKNKDDLSISQTDEIIRDNKRALDWAIDKVNSAEIGKRNTVLNLTAFFLGRKRVPESEAMQLINVAALNGLSHDEAIKTFNSAYNKGLEKEAIDYTVMVKKYNLKNGISFKDDPTDTEFYSHIPLAYNFAKTNSEKLLYNNFEASWYKYNDSEGRWIKSNEETVKVMIKDYFENLISEIRKKYNRLSAPIYKSQEKMWTKSFVESVAAASRWELIKEGADLFDKCPYLVNCKNGTYDIETDTLLPHSSEYFITDYIPVDYEKGFKDKYCNMIIESVQADQRSFLQLLLGQSLVGKAPISQSMYTFLGRGSNGKSTLIDLILKTSGSYGKLQPPDVLLPSNGKEIYALSDFSGLRTAIIEELPDSKQLNSGALKRLVGTEEINARAIYGKNQTFINHSTIFVSCNKLPLVTETDYATWRRLSVFNFPYTYKKNKDEIKTEWDKLGDPKVIYAAHQKQSTAKAFLAWRLEGARKLYLNEMLEITEKPESMKKAEKEWRESGDLIYGFLTENFEVDMDSFVLILDLLDSFNSWLSERGNAKVSMRYFVEALQNHEYFIDCKLLYKKSTSIRGSLKQSVYQDSDLNKLPRSPGQKATYIIGLKFKN